MFTELTDELFDLTVTEKGCGAAVYAANEQELCSSSCGTIVLCCCCAICW